MYSTEMWLTVCTQMVNISVTAGPRGHNHQMNPKEAAVSPHQPHIPSTQVSSSTSVALRTETSLSYNI